IAPTINVPAYYTVRCAHERIQDNKAISNGAVALIRRPAGEPADKRQAVNVGCGAILAEA
ncbi:hypothetical protein LXA24_17495, partial [Erwinia amylovora]|uniref:hypothetical protein n=1 Tax=Erwinia amylovora TaxID=552 RepID=UPI0020BE9582